MHILLQRRHPARLLLAALCMAAMIGLSTPADAEENCSAQHTFLHADDLLKQKRYDDAATVLAPLKNCKSLSNLERFNLGWFYGRAHDFRTSLAIVRSLPADVPNPEVHRYAIALGEFELENYKAVIEALKDSSLQENLGPSSVNLLAVSYSKLGQYQEAYPLLKHEIEKNPQDQLAYLNLVALFADSDDYPHAVEVATQAVEAFPGDPEMNIVLGAANTLQGNYKNAREDFSRAIQEAPQLAQPRFLLAVSDYKQRDFSKAVADIRQASADGINDSDLHYLLAECLSELDANNDKPVMNELNLAIKLNPDNVAARIMRGRLLLTQHHVNEAIADLEIAHRKDPSSHSATFALARAYNAAGRRDQAKTLFAELGDEFSHDLQNQRNMEITDEINEHKLKDALAEGKSKQ